MVAESAATAIKTTKPIESQRSPRAVFVIAPGSVAMSAMRRIVSALGNTHLGSGLKRSGTALMRTMTITTVRVIGHRGSPWTSFIGSGSPRAVLAGQQDGDHDGHDRAGHRRGAPRRPDPIRPPLRFPGPACRRDGGP